MIIQKGGVRLKRLLAMLAVCVLMLGVICLPASAESAASRVELLCTVNSDGDCLVSMTVSLRLEESNNSLTFPLPANAKSITMNGSSSVTTYKSASAVEVDISKITRDYVGEASIHFTYTIPEAVKVNEDRQLQLDIPLLCGFEFPVESLTFTVTMPGAASFDPKFTSIYQQNGVEANLPVSVNGSQIIGSSKASLNDHDGVTMTMLVPQEMFPSVSTYIREGNPEVIPMSVCAAAAMMYWLLFLRCLPLIRRRSSTPPSGVSAGEMGCRLTLSGGDLTMMVFSWAQLGYLLIHLDGDGRVMLHKRMDMGNERSAFENKIFRSLFASRRVVDATGTAYARFALKVYAQVPSQRQLHRGSSGNVKIFRILACGSGLFCGICVAMNMTGNRALQIILSVILAVFGLISAWIIQDVPFRTHLRGKTPVYIGLACVLVWVGLGFLCGQIWIPLCFALGELVLGYFAAYGGRRSDLGRWDAEQILGFRHYAKTLPREDVSRLLEGDPDYFFNLAPYALALGVIKPFARAFGRRQLDQCPYLVSRIHGKRTAEEWAQLMADTADRMDVISRQMLVERWVPLRAAASSLLPRKTVRTPGKKRKKK